jgi:hypothetical protein
VNPDATTTLNPEKIGARAVPIKSEIGIDTELWMIPFVIVVDTIAFGESVEIRDLIEVIALSTVVMAPVESCLFVSSIALAAVA